MGQRRATVASVRSGGWSCYSALRIPHSAFFAVGVFLALQAPDPWPMLDRASATEQTITSLSAEFVQIITNPMIGTPDTTRGRLYQMRPSRFAMRFTAPKGDRRSEEHTSELQSRLHLVCRLLLEKKKNNNGFDSGLGLHVLYTLFGA